MLTDSEAAIVLAKQFKIPIPDPIEPSQQEDEHQFTTLRTLYPGQDYIDGTLYYTVPAFHHTKKKKGKGKDAPLVPTIDKYVKCITSGNEIFAFDETNLYDRGFSFPETVFTPKSDAWGGDIITDIAQDKVKAPEPQAVYTRVRKVYEQYMEFADEMYYDLMTCWVMGTYLFKVFQSFPYLHFNGTKDSGKSQNLRILKILGFNTHWSAEMTAADMYRHIAGNPGVICIDEAESWRGERAEALRSILRSGYSKGMEVSRQRQMPDGHWEQERFPVYCPKALASINPLDDTTRSRTIVVRMRPAIRLIDFFRDDQPERWRGLVDDLHIFGLRNAASVAETYDQWQVKHAKLAPGLTNRSWEISASLISVMAYIWGDEEASRMAEWLTTYFNEQRKLSDSSDITRLLVTTLPAYLKNAMPHDDWWYPVKNILENLLDYMDTDANNKINARSITRYMEPLGFTHVRTGKGGRQVQIKEADLKRVFNERRIEPLEEDLKWLYDGLEYQTPDRIAHQVKAQAFEWSNDGTEG